MDAPPSYLAFDLGASGSRAVLGTLVSGTMQMEELHRFPTPLLETDGGLFWDVEAIWAELQTGLRRALDAAPGLRALSVDSWAVDYVPLDASGQPLRNPFCYRDARTDGVMETAFETLPAAEIYAHTGIQFLPFNTLYQLLADACDDPDTVRRTHLHLPIADYFNYRFSGQAAVERSMASTTQLCDARTGGWADALFDAFGLDGAAWPPIVPSGSRLGSVAGAPQVSVIATCSHDTGCAVAATPLETPHAAYVSCGTWSLLGAERDGPLLTSAARGAGFTNEAGVDSTVRFLKNLTGLWALQECTREWNRTAPVDWQTLEAEAAAVPPRRTVIDLESPLFRARGGMEDRLRAACRAGGQSVPETRGALVRVVLDSIADSYRRALVRLERVTGQRYTRLHLVGGGAQNALLCQCSADACGIPVVAGPVEATALGNLLLQARALGDLPEGATLRDVAARSSSLTTYLPNPTA